MPCGLVRTDLNITGINYLDGFPVTLPLDFGNEVDWAPSPAYFGNPVPPTDPTFNSNPVTWIVNPAHFGNIIGATIVTDAFELENGSGILLLENGSILLQE